MEMNNVITIKASDGKVFTGTLDKIEGLKSELNAYETDLELKKKKAEEDKKEEGKLLEEINSAYESFTNLIKKYEDTYKKTLVYTNDKVSRKKKIEPINGRTMEYFYDDSLLSLLKEIKKLI